MNFRLDISAKPLDSLLSTGDHLDPVKVEQFMRGYQKITEKIDGLKITAFRNENPYGRFSNNWVIAYKNFVLYENEFETGRSLGLSFYQFQHVMVAFKQLHYSGAGQMVPPNTELFLEFAADKSTLMQKYTNSGIFLLGWAASKGEIVGGYLQTSPGTMMTDTNWLTKMPGWPTSIKTPPVLFQGHPQVAPRVGIADDRSYWLTHEFLQLYEQFKADILSMPSCIGPRIEGGVGTLENNGHTFYKIQQPEQNNKAARQALRAQHKYADPEKETAYWDTINKLLDDNLQLDPTQSIPDQLDTLKGVVVSLAKQNLVHHLFKSKEDTYNDLYVTGRLRVLRSRKENQNGLVVGRFQALTAAHTDIIKRAAARHHIVWVAVVNGVRTSQDNQLNPLTFERRKELIEALGLPNVRVLSVPTGSVRNIIASIPSGVTQLYCGTDRFQQYQLAVKNMNVEVVEIPRTTPISGTQLRSAIRSDNKTEFELLVDPQLYSYYEKLKAWM